MTEVHLKSNGSTSYIIPAGYMNRAKRGWERLLNIVLMKVGWWS